MGSLFKSLSPVAMIASSGDGGGTKKAGAAPDIEAERRKKAKSTLLDTAPVSTISEKSTLV